MIVLDVVVRPRHHANVNSSGRGLCFQQEGVFAVLGNEFVGAIFDDDVVVGRSVVDHDLEATGKFIHSRVRACLWIFGLLLFVGDDEAVVEFERRRRLKQQLKRRKALVHAERAVDEFDESIFFDGEVGRCHDRFAPHDLVGEDGVFDDETHVGIGKGS
jgi:hypothetical protein